MQPNIRLICKGNQVIPIPIPQILGIGIRIIERELMWFWNQWFQGIGITWFPNFWDLVSSFELICEWVRIILGHILANFGQNWVLFVIFSDFYTFPNLGNQWFPRKTGSNSKTRWVFIQWFWFRFQFPKLGIWNWNHLIPFSDETTVCRIIWSSHNCPSLKSNSRLICIGNQVIPIPIP